MKQLDKKAVWLFFLNMLVGWLFMLVVFGTWLGVFLIGQFGFSVGGILLLVFGALLVFIGFSWIWAKLSYRYYRYELREDGFRKEQGVIWKKYVTIPYDRIQNIDIHRGVFARLFGLSDLQIQTAGASAVMGRYGASGINAEGRLPGLSREVAEQLRDELVRRAREARTPGL